MGRLPAPALAEHRRPAGLPALRRDLDVSYKIAFVLAHKLREAMASDMKGLVVGGEGAVACTNLAESYFSRLRRSEWGQHHDISGTYLARYTSEMAWREDHRRRSNGEHFKLVTSRAAALGASVDFTGYWQRHLAPQAEA